jgi:hypothetical protein
VVYHKRYYKVHKWQMDSYQEEMYRARHVGRVQSSPGAPSF